MNSDQEKDATTTVPTDQQGHEEPGQSKDTPFEEEQLEDDDENETCGFCIFMKGGGCKKEFIVSNVWSLN